MGLGEERGGGSGTCGGFCALGPNLRGVLAFLELVVVAVVVVVVVVVGKGKGFV